MLNYIAFAGTKVICIELSEKKNTFECESVHVESKALRRKSANWNDVNSYGGKQFLVGLWDLNCAHHSFTIVPFALSCLLCWIIVSILPDAIWFLGDED